MKCGIIGLPNTGKSTFFNFISNSNVLSENFPFCTIEPNYGMTRVPDQRLYELEKIINPIKIIPSEIKIVDIAGIIKGSHKGDGLGNKFLSHIRETNVIIHMIRLFQDVSVSHVEGSINPIRDKEIIDMELQLKDLETIENRLKNVKTKKNKSITNTLESVLSFLRSGKNIRTYPFVKDEKKYIKDLQLLTIKPVLYVCNTDEVTNEKINTYIKELKKIVKTEGSILIILSLIKNRSSDKIDQILKKAYQLLNLQSFFTVSKKEIRSWTIPSLCTAYEASSVIHTDFKKGFIRAEIIHYNDFIKYKSEEKAKKAGKIFLAGKNSLIQDGDIIHFRFNL
ncbi:redox-regulated ATPase YchF [Blattabacterium cuenoti]|uniref:redox-regulated ATPase YchF n=1 Tax=Blattabacterium cuenoti TaxID=1653831 RepID=UPI00163C1A6E|nr:redox-regulated ATPase YchF [Blattabacterium cuenoti]